MKLLTPKQWLKREQRKRKAFHKHGIAQLNSYPWQPWEDHVVMFCDTKQACYLTMRTYAQIKRRRRMLEVRKEPPPLHVLRATVFEQPGIRTDTCPHCKQVYKLAA